MIKYILISIAALTLVACESTQEIGSTDAPMQGKKVRLNASAYHEMCTREYKPELCPESYAPKGDK